jgi:hypothetical protein
MKNSVRATSRLLDALFLVLAAFAIRRTFHDAENYAEDFHVYWKAAHTWLAGGNPYAFTAEDRGFVFKYPPWILPLFLPLGALEWEWARRVWFVTEILTIAYAIRWCVRNGAPRHLAAFVACLFWWMFHAHLSAGQFTLILLQISLWAYPADVRPGDPVTLRTGSGFREGTLAFFLSAKVFSLFALVGIYRRYLRPGPIAWGVGLLAAAHGLLLWMSHATGSGLTIPDYYRGFAAAAASGGAELGAVIVRGQGNHGFTAMILRALGVDSLSFLSDMVTSASVAAVLGLLWHKLARGLTEAERWAGWIGVALVAHPLAWHHSFVLAYPLCALALARASSVKRKDLMALAVFGTCCIGVFIPQVMGGKEAVRPFELAGMKSWGVVLAAVSLALAARAAGATTASITPSAKEPR